MFGINFFGGRSEDSLSPQFKKGAKIRDRHSIDVPPPGSEYLSKETKGLVNPHLGQNNAAEKQLGSVDRLIADLARSIRLIASADIEKEVREELKAKGVTEPTAPEIEVLVEQEIQRRAKKHTIRSLNEQRANAARSGIITQDLFGDMGDEYLANEE